MIRQTDWASPRRPDAVSRFVHTPPLPIISAVPVTIAPGTRLGAYEVGSLLGEGGMGQVYRATDTRLKRDSAIKILTEGFASDPDRLARFQRETELLAHRVPVGGTSSEQFSPLAAHRGAVPRGART
jgi:serine/threonine protein kinase